MGSSLYIKRNLKTSAPAYSTDSVSTHELSDFLPESEDPSAPNYFKEGFVSSNEINFSFSPAKSTDRKFRLEFYDYVDRFDRIVRGEEGPPTPKRAVDMMSDMRDDTVTDASGTGVIVRKNAVWFDSATGEGEVTYPEFRTLGEKDTIGIAAGRTVYTDGGGATIRYAVNGQELSEGATIELPKYGNVEFLAIGQFRVEEGNVYLFEASAETKTMELSKLRGLPSLPETKVVLTKPASKISMGYHDGSSFDLRGPAEYSTYSLGTVSPNYSVTIPQSNDWYYSKLYAFEGETRGAEANLTLLSPQLQADKEGPLVEFPSNYRIPVYVKESVNLKRYVSDVS